jgi:hypothetical protein
MRRNASTRRNDAPKSYRDKVTPEDLAMAHPDYIVSNVVALTLLAAVAALLLSTPKGTRDFVITPPQSS